MKTFFLNCLTLFFLWSGLLFTTAVSAQADQAAYEERYGITLYGIDLPPKGANLLLIIDASKSMNRKDAARATPGKRWDTLIDEVTAMQEAMKTCSAERGVPFSVSILFEGGDAPQAPLGPFNPSKPADCETLLTTLKEKPLLSGGNFETTFQETLWPFVSKHAITYIVYLGDDDIGTYASTVREALSQWYAPAKDKPTPATRKTQKLKANWRLHWKTWRPPKRGTPTFKNTRPLPPPPKDVTFSCVAIGQDSSLLKEITTLGNGIYVARKSKSKSKKSKK
jgi:hypothetical protein